MTTSKTTSLTRAERVNADITALLRARNTLLWIVTPEEVRVERAIIEAAAAAKYTTLLWDCATGVSEATGRVRTPNGDPGAVLSMIKDSPERAVYVLRDFHKWLDPVTLRGLRSRARELQSAPPQQARAIVVLSPSADIPPELAGCATVINYPIPDRAEMGKILDAVIATLPEELRVGVAANGTREASIDAAVGLTAEEATNCYARSLVTSRTIDPVLVAGEKKRVIAREKVLTWYDPDPRGLDGVGGLDVLKDWLTSRRSAFSERARAYGLPAPKGVFLVGVPGCGKSLTAKCIASAWAVPLLRLDLGALKSKFVGESEANVRKALAVAETVSPCVDGDTLVTLANGQTMTARALYESGVECDLMAIDVSTGTRSVNRLKAIVRKSAGEAGMADIDTMGGRLTCRADHRVLTTVGWRAASDLKPGDDVLYLQREVPQVDPVSGTSFVPEGTRQLPSGEFRLGGGGFRDATVPRFPEMVDESIGLLLGCLDSDGSWCANGHVEYRTSIQEHAEHVADLVEQRFGTRPKIYRNENTNGAPGGYASQPCYLVRLRKMIGLFLANVRASLFEDRMAYLWKSWLRAFIQGDGCVMTTKIAIVQKHGPMRADVMEMLRRFGIFARDTDRIGIEVTGAERVTRLHAELMTVSGLPNDKFVRTTPATAKWMFTRGVESKGPNTVACTVKAIRFWDAPEYEVYDLCCEEPHNYIANGSVSHNCVLWLDEIEKALAGSTGEQGDGGVSADALGAVLSWMQERQGSVFVVATANDVRALPPELLRKGRFDEVFWVDLPTMDERREILRAALGQHGRTVEGINLLLLAQITVGFTGAEIAALVPDALFDSFADGERAIETGDLLKAAGTVVPLSKTAAEKIEGLRAWAKGRARPASTPQETVTSTVRALDL